MIKTYKQGFSLAEALVTLIIISLILAATMPVVLRSQNSPSEAPWKYVTQGSLSQNAAVFSVLGATSTALFGDKRIPIDSNTSGASNDTLFATRLNPKISIITRDRSNNPVVSRHLIDFYEKETNGNYTNIGKISFDRFYNLSLGLNSLDSIKSETGDEQAVVLATSTNDDDWSDLNFSSPGVLDATTKGALNTAVGQYTMAGNTRYLTATSPARNLVGNANTALGAFALRRLKNGNFNTAIGAYALQSSSLDSAGNANTTELIGSGNLNTAVGTFSMKFNTSGSNNTATGGYSLCANTTGNNNTAFGASVLQRSTTASFNAGFGSAVLSANTTGQMNTGLGTASLIANTTGSGNIAIGYRALSQNETGRGNIAIGNNIAAGISNSESNKLYIGGVTNEDGSFSYNGTDSLIYGDMANRKLVFNGKAYIKAEGTEHQIATVTDVRNFIALAKADIMTGNITLSTEPPTIYSDARLKNIIGENKAGLKEIMQVQVKNYTMKRDKKKEVLVGVIAQELQKIFPNSVIEGRDGYLRIKRDEIFYACINAIKELNNMFKDLAAKVTGLDEKIRLLEDRNKMNEDKIATLERQNKLFEERLAALEETKKAPVKKVKEAKETKVTTTEKTDKTNETEVKSTVVQDDKATKDDKTEVKK